MGKSSTLALFSALLCFSLLLVNSSVSAITTGTADGMERWGYVEVRPKAHLFWWYYKSPQKVFDPSKPWPTILWLQGGPGASGVGLGNFLEMGPLDVNLKPRNATWLQKADLIFVDNPVGVGYSYVEDESLLVTTDKQAATDATTLLKALTKEIPSLQSSHLFLVAESYGGEYAATLGVSVANAINAGELKLTLGAKTEFGSTFNSWISPEDFTLSYGPLLLYVSRLDSNGAADASKKAEAVRQQIAAGQLANAQISWSTLVGSIVSDSGNVNIYNFLLDSGMDPVSTSPASSQSSNLQLMKYSKYLGSKVSDSNTIDGIMNGVIKEKLKIIPKNLKWQELSIDVYNALVNDFMKPRINEIDELLAFGVNVTVYNGQLDVICSTIGAEAWVQKLKWDGLKNFLSLPRLPLYCGSDKVTKGFLRSYKNLHFYWILGAGHFVPIDQPCIALSMISSIIQSPATSL